MKYKTISELESVFATFENGTISRDSWGHAEHLIVAFFYASNNEFETALEKMRAGIFNLLDAFGVDLTKEMPYHETMTVFWMRSVYEFAETKSGCSIVESCAEMIEKFDKDYPMKFYSRELLFSEMARMTYVPANLSFD